MCGALARVVVEEGVRDERLRRTESAETLAGVLPVGGHSWLLMVRRGVHC